MKREVRRIADFLRPDYTIYAVKNRARSSDISASMLRSYARKAGVVNAVITAAAALRFVLTAASAPQALSNAESESASNAAGIEQAYAGTNQCFVCHRPQANAWSETEHVHAHDWLPDQYKNDPACLACHVTGFGARGGYVAGTEKDLSMVGCEACHGPGARHIDAAQRFILADPGEEEEIEAQIRATIVKIPNDQVCAACHTTQAHGRHPEYESEAAAETKSAAIDQSTRGIAVANCLMPSEAPATAELRYSVKTCGGCHFDQYTRWRLEKHSALSTMLTAEYRNAAECQHCHSPTRVTPATSNGTSHPHDNHIGVACESCHGPALHHVRFNRQFISKPRLGPKLEEAARDSIAAGKPAAACAQCHMEQGHKEHPEIGGK